jgi:hypothetical protein
MMSAEKSRARAEQLIGEPMKYINGTVRAADWFRAQSREVIERSMDEGFLVSNMELHLQHVAALCREGEMEIPEGDAQQRFAAMVNPPVSAIMTCKNVFVVYWEQHGETFKF